MNVTGATISDEVPYSETRDIVLPNQTESVSQIAVDVRIFLSYSLFLMNLTVIFYILEF